MHNTSHMKKLVQPDPYNDTPDKQKGGSPTTEASKEIELAPPTVTAQYSTLLSKAMETPPSLWPLNTVVRLLGPVVQMPVSADQELNLNLGFFFFLSKALSSFLYSI